MAKSMSSGNSNNGEIFDFANRFAEACGTAEPARVQRLLNISYQAAKNYLNGRLPDPRVLITIAERTPYSIHWLLTGKGEKFSISEPVEDTPSLARQISQLIRQEVQAAVTEAVSPQAAAGTRTIVLRADEVLSESIRTEVSDHLNKT
jgi:hypothetical protein